MKASDLRNNPVFHKAAEAPEAPVKTVVDKLSIPEGKGLQLTTRTSPSIARAMHTAYLYGELFGIEAIKGEGDLLMRLAVSQGGEGRRDLIDSLTAGGSLPAEFYGRAPKTDAAYLREREKDP